MLQIRIVLHSSLFPSSCTHKPELNNRWRESASLIRAKVNNDSHLKTLRRQVIRLKLEYHSIRFFEEKGVCLRSIIARIAAGQHVREAKQKHACPWRAIRVSHERGFVRNRPRPVTRTWPTERVFTKRTRATEKMQVWPDLA